METSMTLSSMVESSSDDEFEFDIDQSILKHVKAAVGRVATFQNGEPNPSDEENDQLDENPTANGIEGAQRPMLSSSELLDRRILELQEQAAVLEAEIGQLEQDSLSGRTEGGGGGGGGGGGVTVPGEEVVRGDMLEQMVDQMIQSVAKGCVSDGAGLRNKEEFLAKLCGPAAEETDEIKELSSQIRLSEALTGIKLEAVDWEVVRKQGPELFREHRHAGSIEGYSFSVTFVAKEEQGVCRNAANEEVGRGCKDGDTFSCTDRVVSLKPEVDGRARTDLQGFLTRVSSDCDLLGFYQMYSSYCSACRWKRETWNTLQSTLDRSVSLSGGPDGNRLCYHDRSGMSLNFTWDIVVPAYGISIEERIAVQTKTPSNASRELLEKVSALPHHLEDLVKEHGVRRGLLKFFMKLEPAASWQDK